MHGGKCSACAAAPQPTHECPTCAQMPAPMDMMMPLLAAPPPMAEAKPNGKQNGAQMKAAAKQLLKKIKDLDFDKVLAFDLKIEMAEEPFKDAPVEKEPEEPEESEEADETKEENKTHAFA